MKRSPVHCIVVIGLLWVGQTQAVMVTQRDSRASTAAADCSLPDCSNSGVLFSDPDIRSPSSSGRNKTFARLLEYENHVGRITPSASTTPEDGVSRAPLKARNEPVPDNGWGSVMTMEIQGYKSTGSEKSTISLDSALSGSLIRMIHSDITGPAFGVWMVMDDPAVAFPEVSSMSQLLGSSWHE